MALLDNETKDEIIDLVVWGAVLAIVVGVMGYVLARFGRR